MSAIIYDFPYATALCSLAYAEGLLRSNSTVKDYRRDPNSNFVRWLKGVAPNIYSDLVTYEQIIIPDYVNEVFDLCEPNLFRLKDTFEVPKIPHSLEQGIIKSYVEQDFLRHAIQLKPFFLENIIYQMGEPEKEPLLWSPILRCKGDDVVADFNDLYDFFFIWMVSDANSALGCIRNYELRMYILDWLVASLYYDPKRYRNEGFQISVLQDDNLIKGFLKLVYLLWEPCSLIDYSSLFSVPIRAATINTHPRRKQAFPRAAQIELAPREALDRRAAEDAFVILKNELSQHIHITPQPNSISEALLMREKKGWRRFREQLTQYQQLFAGNVSERAVAEEIVRDIKLAQKELESAKDVKKNSSRVNYASISMATLELILGIPSYTSIALAVIGQALSSKAEQMVNLNSWILLGDMSSIRKRKRQGRNLKVADD